MTATIIQGNTIFNDHFSYIEQLLLAQSAVQGTTGHTLHKGTPREAFISNFIKGHVGNGVGIGTGEIIDARSKSGARRNQIDIVLHDERIARFDVGGNVSIFPIEGVRATIEVKSTLTKEDLFQACSAAENIEALQAQWPSKHEQPRIPRRFLAAYAGPASMQTVFGWLTEYYEKAEFPRADKSKVGLTQAVPAGEEEILPYLRSTTLDGIFVFGLGAILFPSFSFTPQEESLAPPKPPVNIRNILWRIMDCKTGAAHLMFLCMMEAIFPQKNMFTSYADTLRFDNIDRLAIAPRTKP